MSSIQINGNTSGSITIEAPAVAGTNTLTLPASTGTIVTDTGAQTIQFSAGTAAAPSVTTTGDTNTGIFFPAADTIAFAEGGAEAMRINSSGELLMNGRYGGHDSNSTGAITLNANASDGTVNFKKGIVFSSDGGDAQSLWAHAGITSTGSAGFNGNLLFGTDGTGTQSGTITERMRITNSGNVLMGTTDASITSGPGFKIRPSATNTDATLVQNTSASLGSFILYNTNATNNGYRFYVTTNGGIANYSGNNVNLSDERSKKNIEIANNYLDKICSIPIKLFNYKDEVKDEQKTLGVIAQDVEKIAPEFVNTESFGDTPEDGIPLKSIYTTDLMFALMKSIQEQQDIIKALETRIQALEVK